MAKHSRAEKTNSDSPNRGVQASTRKAESTASATSATGLLLEAAPVKGAIGEDEGPTGTALGADALGAEVLAITSG